MITRNAHRARRPAKGLVAFVRAAAVGLPGTCCAILHPAHAGNLRWASLKVEALDRSEGRMQPGEGSA